MKPIVVLSWGTRAEQSKAYTHVVQTDDMERSAKRAHYESSRGRELHGRQPWSSALHRTGTELDADKCGSRREHNVQLGWCEWSIQSLPPWVTMLRLSKADESGEEGTHAQQIRSRGHFEGAV